MPSQPINKTKNAYLFHNQLINTLGRGRFPLPR